MNWKQLFKTKPIHQIALEMAEHELSEHALKKVLGVWDLTAFGVAAIVGAGIFSTIGNASYYGGPAVVFLFIFTAIACAFSAFCYAEFAAILPISGSAYTYAYASFGEILAWIIGWDLLMEYAISNIAVAISWSEYFTALLAGYGVQVPKHLTMDFLSAYRGFHQVEGLLLQGNSLETLALESSHHSVLLAHQAWLESPVVFGVHLICNLPALLITVLVTSVAYFGMKESKRASNIMVMIKVAVILLVIGLGCFYIHPANWVPFAPNGVSGVFKGVSAVFFAYIGFDAISTTAEECENPQRDLPRGMIYSLLICTVLYVLMALVLTGMVNHHKLDVGDPLAFVFGPEGANIPWVSGVISISAIVALFTVLLVYQLGQPRIWMSMSRDGLLPPIFSAIHPRFKTPWFSTIFTGVLVAIPSLFMNLTEVTDLTSTGTLFAFTLVCAGVLKLDPQSQSQSQSETQGQNRKFRIPYINSKIFFPLLVGVAGVCLLYWNSDGVSDFFSTSGSFKHKIPMMIYGLEILVLVVLCFVKELSLIPVMGLVTCTYLMTELGITNWIRFGAWLVVGFFVYFLYGMKHSKLRRQTLSAEAKNS